MIFESHKRVKVSGRSMRRAHFRMYVTVLSPIFGRRGASVALRKEGGGWRTPGEALACHRAAFNIIDYVLNGRRRG